MLENTKLLISSSKLFSFCTHVLERKRLLMSPLSPTASHDLFRALLAEPTWQETYRILHFHLKRCIFSLKCLILHFTGSRCPDFILQQAIRSLLSSSMRVKPQHVALLNMNPTETPDVKLLKFGADRANNKPKLENSSTRDAWKLPVTQCVQCADFTITARDFILICHSEHTHAHTWMQLHCRLIRLLKNGPQSKK